MSHQPNLATGRRGRGSRLPRLSGILKAIGLAYEAFCSNNLVKAVRALLPLKRRPMLATVLVVTCGTGTMAAYYFSKSGRWLNYMIIGGSPDAGVDVVTIVPMDGWQSGTGVHLRQGDRQGKASWRLRFLDWLKLRETGARVVVLQPRDEGRVSVRVYSVAHSESERCEFKVPEGADGFAWRETIHFTFDRASLEPDDRDAIAAVADMLRKNRHLSVIVGGHADSRGTASYNSRLAERRATEVVRELIRNGISPTRLVSVTFGEGKPITTGESEPAHMRNRRADFVFVPSAALR